MKIWLASSRGADWSKGTKKDDREADNPSEGLEDEVAHHVPEDVVPVEDYLVGGNLSVPRDDTVYYVGKLPGQIS